MRVLPVASPIVVATPSAQATASGRTVVPLQRTPASSGDIRSAISRAVQHVTGQPARPSLLAVLTAHASLETGTGRGMYNYNFGGIKGTGPSGLTASSATHEVVGGRTVATQAGFRAYNTLDEGAQDYVSLLSRRYPEALQAAAGGDVDGFAHALRQGGYYSATEASYANGLRGILGMPQRTDTGSEPGGSVPTNVAIGAGTDASGYSTMATLGRVMDALSASALNIARPTEEDPT